MNHSRSLPYEKGYSGVLKYNIPDMQDVPQSNQGISPNLALIYIPNRHHHREQPLPLRGPGETQTVWHDNL